MKLKIKSVLNLLLIFSFLVHLNSCIVAYRRYPDVSKRVGMDSKLKGPLLYDITGTTSLNGNEAIRNVFRNNPIFRTVERVDSMPGEGLFVKVRIETVSVSMSSVAGGFISYLTLTLVPCWSTRDGANIFYEVYLDGKRLKTFEYEFRRFIMIWIVNLPLIWVNLFTPSEYGAVEATAKKFFEEADTLLRNPNARAPLAD